MSSADIVHTPDKVVMYVGVWVLFGKLKGSMEQTNRVDNLMVFNIKRLLKLTNRTNSERLKIALGLPRFIYFFSSKTN